MTYRIAKRFEFAASHVLDGLAADHPCSRLHGHNYAVEVELEAALLDPVGFVFDYRALDPFKRWIDVNLDHRHLNDRMEVNPTAEHLAHWLWFSFGDVVALPSNVTLAEMRVCETPKTVAAFRA